MASMISSSKFIGVLDTNVIYPVYLRDMIFSLADLDVFTIKWSKDICSEWELVMKKKNIPDDIIKNQIERATIAFPDALVENYDQLIPALNLPDEKDCHVLAAAIKTNANVIVTNNIKDFPEDYLKSFNLIAQTPDNFITDAIDLDIVKAVEAFKGMVGKYKNPPLDEMAVLEILRKNKLIQTANYIYSQL